ncbi:MAG: hypothetical protein IPM94_14205 [bacterium]|nr:hypothetical protein [bacterium]
MGINPEAVAEVQRGGRVRWRMFTTEGVVFLLAAGSAGTTILTLASRRERDFRRARELFLAGATRVQDAAGDIPPLPPRPCSAPTCRRTPACASRGAMLQDVEAALEAMVEQVLSVPKDEDHLRGTP